MHNHTVLDIQTESINLGYMLPFQMQSRDISFIHWLRWNQ